MLSVTGVQESSYTKHMAGHASSMMHGGRITSYNGCGDERAGYHHVFSDVDAALYRRRNGVDGGCSGSGEMKKTGSRLFRPAAMSTADAAELSAADATGRYGGLFSAAGGGGDSTPFGRAAGGHKTTAAVVGGSLVDALNDASSPASNRSDCGDAAASSPLVVNGAAAAGAGALAA